MGERGREGPSGGAGSGRPPSFRSHFLPRTREGRRAAFLFIALFALTQPPVVHVVANRISPWILGLPFLYAWLLGAYLGLIAVLIAAARRNI